MTREDQIESIKTFLGEDAEPILTLGNVIVKRRGNNFEVKRPRGNFSLIISARTRPRSELVELFMFYDDLWQHRRG